MADTAVDFALKAKEAFVDDEFQLAVEYYSQAIELNPGHAGYFADRAQAQIKLQNFTDAVADANRAIELESSLAKAYLRKGTACVKLEEYQTAKAALEVGASLAPDDSRFTKLLKECEEHIAEENGVLNKPSNPASNGSQASGVANGAEQPQEIQEMEVEKPKYRHAFYQKPDEVVVTVFAKGIAATNVAVEFGEQILSVAIDVPGEKAYSLQTRLFGKIVPDRCKYEVLSTKVEIRLAKAEPINWTTLEYSQQQIVTKSVVSSAVGRPVYPSSKRRDVDWDKLEAQVKKEEKEEKLDGDAGVNKMFGEIYRNADEDMRRAMNKSFLESNGTVLSTNWKDVGAKKVESTPPDGMELKKWEY